MTDREMLQKCFEALEHYRQTFTPKERFAHMVARGIINEKGEVLVTREEREAGHPIEDEGPANGEQAK